MKIEEANKICAEFDGWVENGDTWFAPNGKEWTYLPFFYANDLNRLISLWEKLDCNFVLYHPSKNSSISSPSSVAYRGVYNEHEIGDSIQHTACITTAKAIKELK